MAETIVESKRPCNLPRGRSYLYEGSKNKVQGSLLPEKERNSGNKCWNTKVVPLKYVDDMFKRQGQHAKS